MEWAKNELSEIKLGDAFEQKIGKAVGELSRETEREHSGGLRWVERNAGGVSIFRSRGHREA